METPLEFVRRKTAEIRGAAWTHHEYPLWAAGLSKRSKEILEAAEEDDGIAEAMTELRDAIEAKRGVLLDGRTEAAADSQLAIVRSALGAKRVEFWWLW